jgi:hypothetical protein
LVQTMLHNKIVKELATLAMELQSVQKRPHLPYHSAKHPYTFFETALSSMMYLHQQGIKAEMGITEEEFFAIYFAMVFISLFHDNSFELTSQGFPDPQNEEVSFISAVPFIKSTFGDLVNTNHVHIGMTHTKVGFDSVSGLVSSPVYTGTVVEQLIQLLSELGDKVHLYDLTNNQSVEEMFLKGFEDNLRLRIELELRKMPEKHGNIEACSQYVADYVQSSDEMAERIFDEVCKAMMGFFRISVIDHIQEKFDNSDLAKIPSLVAMIKKVFVQYEDLIDVTKDFDTSADKAVLTRNVSADILKEYYH